MAFSFSKKQSPREIALQGDHRELLLIPLNLIIIGAVIFMDYQTASSSSSGGDGNFFMMLVFALVGGWIVRTLKNRNQALISIIDDLETRLADLETRRPSSH